MKASQSVASLWLIFRVLNKWTLTIFASIWLYRDLHPAIEDFSSLPKPLKFLSFKKKYGGHLGRNCGKPQGAKSDPQQESHKTTKKGILLTTRDPGRGP